MASKEKEVPKEKEAAAKLQANGITRPASGKTLRVWEIADKLSAIIKKPVTRKEVIEAAEKEDINSSTAATQYGKWRTYHGLGKEVTIEAKPVAVEKVTPAKKTVAAKPVVEEAEEAEEAEEEDAE